MSTTDYPFPQNIDQMNGMEQVIMAVPTQDELNTAAAVKRQEFIGPTDVIEVPAIGVVIPADNALAGNDIIRLSKNQKLRMAHRGFIELDQTWQTQPTYVTAPGGTGTAYQYVAPAPRPLLPVAETDDGIVYTSVGTFADVTGFRTLDYANNPIDPFESFPYNNNASSSSANDGLVGPTITALAADLILQNGTINDMPGRTGGAAMTGENYLSFPGDPVLTDQTAQYYLDKIDAMRIAANASALVYSDIVNAGIDPNNVWTGLYPSKPAKLTNYKADIVAATTTITRAVLGQIVFTANH